MLDSRTTLKRSSLTTLTTLALTAALALFAAPATATATALTSPDLVAGAAEQFTRREPLVIRRPGSYDLRQNLEVRRGETGPAIVIEGSDVTLDLGGHVVAGPGESQGVAISIDGATNVRISNGTVNSAGIGVQVTNSTNVVISDLQIDADDAGGAPPAVEIGVLIVDSKGVVVRDNVITDTFLGIFVRGAASTGNYIADNVITGGDNGELAICYNPAPGAVGGPTGDMITGNVISRFRRAFSFSEDSVGNILRGNSFAYFDLGIVEQTPGGNVIGDNDEVQIPR